MTALVLYGALALGVSFICSLLEAGLLSLPRSAVHAMVDRGSASGRALLEMKDNIDRPLAGILTLNTIAHTVGAAGVGAQAAIVFGDAAVGIASALMTLLILVVSEIIPKTLGAVHARSLAPVTAALIRATTILTLPVLIPLEWLNRLIASERAQERLSRAELLSTLRLGHRSGAMEQHEYQIASNLVTLSSTLLKEVMTPRTVVFSLPQRMTVGEAASSQRPLRFARIPVYEEGPDQARRYVPRFEIDTAFAAGEGDTRLEELARDMPIFPEQASVLNALERFLKEKHQIALVVDEYGAMAGVVTLEDLLETLLGEEIVDETDAVEDMRDLAKRHRRRKRG